MKENASFIIIIAFIAFCIYTGFIYGNSRDRYEGLTRPETSYTQAE